MLLNAVSTYLLLLEAVIWPDVRERSFRENRRVGDGAPKIPNFLSHSQHFRYIHAAMPPTKEGIFRLFGFGDSISVLINVRPTTKSSITKTCRYAPSERCGGVGTVRVLVIAYRLKSDLVKKNNLGAAR